MSMSLRTHHTSSTARVGGRRPVRSPTVQQHIPDCQIPGGVLPRPNLQFHPNTKRPVVWDTVIPPWRENTDCLVSCNKRPCRRRRWTFWSTYCETTAITTTIETKRTTKKDSNQVGYMGEKDCFGTSCFHASRPTTTNPLHKRKSSPPTTFNQRTNQAKYISNIYSPFTWT